VFDVRNGISLAASAKLTVNGPATYNVHGGITMNSGKASLFRINNHAVTSTFNVAGGIPFTSGAGTFPDGACRIGNTGGNGHYGGSTCAVAVHANRIRLLAAVMSTASNRPRGA
jgi:hypothetical protein